MVRKVERERSPYPPWKECTLVMKLLYVIAYGLGTGGVLGGIVFYSVLDINYNLSINLSIFIYFLAVLGIFAYARSRRRRIMKSPNPATKKVVYYVVIFVAIVIMGVMIAVTIFHEPDPQKGENSVFMFRLLMGHGIFIVLVFLIAYIYLSKKETIKLAQRTQAEKINNGQIYEIYKDVLKGKFVDIPQLKAYLPSDENGVLDRLLDELVEHQEALQGKQRNIDKSGLEYLLVFAGTLLFSTPAGIDDIGEFYDEIKKNEELHSEVAIVRFLKEYIEVFHMPPAILFKRFADNFSPRSS